MGWKELPYWINGSIIFVILSPLIVLGLVPVFTIVVLSLAALFSPFLPYQIKYDLIEPIYFKIEDFFNNLLTFLQFHRGDMWPSPTILSFIIGAILCLGIGAILGGLWGLIRGKKEVNANLQGV